MAESCSKTQNITSAVLSCSWIYFILLHYFYFIQNLNLTLSYFCVWLPSEHLPRRRAALLQPVLSVRGRSWRLRREENFCQSQSMYSIFESLHQSRQRFSLGIIYLLICVWLPAGGSASTQASTGRCGHRFHHKRPSECRCRITVKFYVNAWQRSFETRFPFYF